MNYNDIINLIGKEQARIIEGLIDAKSISNMEEYKFQLGQYHGFIKCMNLLKRAMSKGNED